MRLFLLFLTLSVLLPSLAYAQGGGCRRDSLPACCHMDNSTGIVHCH
jgi:hypothetical protein